MAPITPYTVSIVSALKGVATATPPVASAFTTSAAHGLFVGSAFYFPSLGSSLTPPLTAPVRSTPPTLYFVCSVPSAISFTFATNAACTAASLILLNADKTSLSEFIAVAASYSASKNVDDYISASAGQGFLTSQTGGFKGYRLSIARMSGRGWSDFYPNSATNYDHWLPKNKWYASDVYMTSWNDVPRSVALSNVNTVGLSTIHANEVFYATGYTSASAQAASDYNDKNSFAAVGSSAALPQGSAGSIRARCFKGVSDYVSNNWDNNAGSYPYTAMATLDPLYGSSSVGFSGATSSARIDTAHLTSGSCTYKESGALKADAATKLSVVALTGALGVTSTSTTVTVASPVWTTATSHNLAPGSTFVFKVVPAATSPATILFSTTDEPATDIPSALLFATAATDSTPSATIMYYVCSTPTATTFTFARTSTLCAVGSTQSLVTWSTPPVTGTPSDTAPVAPTTQFKISPRYLRAADSTAGCMSPFYAFQYSNGYKCTTSTTTAGCQCFASDFVTVDPGNTDGTTGFCYVGPSSSSELRLLSVRPKQYGAIYGWPQGPNNNVDTTYTPSLATGDYSVLGASYMPTSISITANNAGAKEYGGASYKIPANLRNCAGRTASASVAFDTQSSVFWVEFKAPDGFAVARSDYTSSFSQPYPVWKQGATVNTIAGVAQTETYPPLSLDNDIVGVTYYQWDGSTTSSAQMDVVYVTSTTAMYASTNAFETKKYEDMGGVSYPAGCGGAGPNSVQCLRDVQWYIIQQIGVGDSLMSGTAGSSLYGYKLTEYRGVAYAPRACAATGATFRALAAPEAEDEEAHA